MINTTDSSSRTIKDSRAFLTTRSHTYVTSMNDNLCDYSSFDMCLVFNYMNNQLIYYFITDAILATDQTEFDENSARFSTSHQKIILISIILDKQLKTMFNSAVKDTLILSHY